MTLLGLVELSQTPKRAVRGLVLSVFACPRACAQPGPAARIATMKTLKVMNRLLTRIELLPFETELKRRAYSITLLVIAPGGRCWWIVHRRRAPSRPCL